MNVAFRLGALTLAVADAVARVRLALAITILSA